MLRRSLTAAFAAAAMLMTCGEASAGVIRFDPALRADSRLTTEIQFRGGGHGARLHGGGMRGGMRHGFGRHGGFGRGGFGHRGGFGRGGFRHGGFGYHRGYGGHGFGHHRGYGRRGVGAGLAGFAAGAALGATLAPGYGAPGYDGAAPVRGTANAIAYCEQRFKSYDRASGTYTGYDGLKHRCP